MASSGERALAHESLIDGAALQLQFVIHLRRVRRFKPQDRQIGVEFLRSAGNQFAKCEVVSAAFQLQPLNLATFGRLLGHKGLVWFVVFQFVLEYDQVNGNFVLARLILLDSCQERLWKEESAHPEGGGRALLLPLPEKLDSVVEVLDPVAQRFDREEAAALLLRPVLGDVVVHQEQTHFLEVVIHYDAAAVGVLEVVEVGDHCLH
mmetsp:Transcript_286/g.598  ORF Transcript_286/g.598 Transcript_286/m.598 type:complete len:206 (-) Transcript_286:1228-1845(-)